MITKWARLTEPTAEPLTLDQAKEHLRIESDFTLDDDLIRAYISAARDRCEKYCNRAWSEAQFYAIFPGLPDLSEPFYLPFPDVTEVIAISYYDSVNAERSIASSDYMFDPSRQWIITGDAWPTTARGLKVTFTAGPDLDSSPADPVPEGVLMAMKLYIADFYEHRTAQVFGSSRSENMAAAALLNPYRVEMGV